MESQHKARRHQRREEPDISQDTSGRSDEQIRHHENIDAEVEKTLEEIDRELELARNAFKLLVHV